MTHEDYFQEAAKVARNATCGRAQCGAVIVAKNGSIIGRGYNAPPLGDETQRMCNTTLDHSIKKNNDKTCCVHAEWNALLDALKSKESELVQGSTLYFMRVDSEGEFTEAGEPYCTVCSRLSLESGVSVFGLWNDGPDMISTDTYNIRSYQYFQG